MTYFGAFMVTLFSVATVCVVVFTVVIIRSYLYTSICLSLTTMGYRGGSLGGEPADAEIKVPSVETPELIGSLFKGWSWSEQSHACFTYCKGFRP